MTPTPSTPEQKPIAKAENARGGGIRLDSAIDNLLSRQAKKLKMSEGKYASAAIAYFAQNGINPTTVEQHNLVTLRSKVGEADIAGRKYTAEVGNRIVAIIRSFESQLYTMLHAQQTNTFTYLERIEEAIIDHLLGLESKLLTPMFERVVRTGVENFMVRRMA